MEATEHICVLGAGGMLGRAIVAWLEKLPSNDDLRSCFAEPESLQHHPAMPSFEGYRFTELDIDDLDITRSADVADLISQIRPTVVINAAAYTDVDGCESQAELATAVNATGPAHLAEACRQTSARLVHLSTDYVFDGETQEPYRPDDPLRPLSAYGRSKAEGESQIRHILPDRHLIVRTSWLFGEHGDNFVKTMRKLGAERDELRVVTDQVGCPTYARDLAAALLILVGLDQYGTLHFCNTGICSWNAFAVEILRLAGSHCRVLPQRSTDLQRPAPRPAYSALNTESFTQATGLLPRSWQASLRECMNHLKGKD